MNVFRLTVSALFLFTLSTFIYSQDLFENASKDSSAGNSTSSSSTDKSANKTIDVSGFVKGAFFGGSNDNNDAIMLGSYGQTALKLNAEKNGVGNAFAEVRLNAGYDRGVESAKCDVREAWAAFNVKGVDVKVGRQIIVWGRADAINPTNNITPQNQLVLSSEVDDSRLGNELLQFKTKIGQSTIQGIWVPSYRSDVLLLNSSILPAGVSINNPVYPDFRFTNGSYALRVDFTTPSVDGSVSYFNGNATLPGFDWAMDASGLSLTPKAYRMHVIGGDFSTTAGAYGLRGEVAAKIPTGDYENTAYIPHPFGQLVLGVDRSFGDFSVLVQYAGLYVYKYKDLNNPVLADASDPYARMAYQVALTNESMAKLNRQFTGTTDEFSHSITANVQWNTMHETLHLKLSGFYNITTEEYAVVPNAGYDIADAISLNIGGRYLDGKDGSLDKLVKHMMSDIYTELKISF